MESYDIIIIGAGAAGLMAAVAASEYGKKVCVIEKNEKPGKKIYITGKGRCNLTNLCSRRDFLSCVVNNAKFLYSSIYSFDPEETYDFFEKSGLPLKVERGNRVFPVSDKASDVTKTLVKNCSADFLFEHNVKSIEVLPDGFRIACENKNKTVCKLSKKLIIATGGMSYPSTGSTGDGYIFARKLGHNVIKPVPALVGFVLKDDVSELSGLTLKNVKVKAKGEEEFGEMLFTEKGLSGPIILTLSSRLNRATVPFEISLDFKPALDKETLDGRMVREINNSPNKDIANIMKSLLPSSLISRVLRYAGIAENTKANALTKEQRASIVNALKDFRFIVEKLAGFEEAVVTSGGVDVNEINPSTMESKLIKNLYFAGEVIDVDAKTGGFNLQIAWATGRKAGISAAKDEEDILHGA